MKLCSIVSGSSGNCVYVESAERKILVDAGCSVRQIGLSLQERGVDPKDLDAILVTHEHGDHVSGLGAMSRRYHLPIYANQATWQAMMKRVGRIPSEHRRLFKDKETFDLGDLAITPFPIHHDAADPVGFAITSEDGKVSITTDTGFIDEKIIDTIQGSDIYYFEANHDVDMVLSGPYPQALKERILSSKGHLSNEQSGHALTELLRGQDEVVLLAHMSVNNNLPELCEGSVRELLMANGFDLVHDKVVLAPRYAPSDLYSCQYEGGQSSIL